MVCSNWQGAIWRGAMLVLLFCSGLAWTQAPTPRQPSDAAERIMVVHENGKATRCRVLESWQLPDRRIAHLLQSTETGEMITIVDEHAPTTDSGDVKNAKAMAKRIFAWGAGRRTPPDGSPIPPNLRIDSGTDTVSNAGPAIINSNRVVDEKALGGTHGGTHGRHPQGVLPIGTQDPPLKVEGPVFDANAPKTQTSAAPMPIVSEQPCQTIGPVIVSQPATFPRLQSLASRLRTAGALSSSACEAGCDPRVVSQPIVNSNPTTVVEYIPGTIIDLDKKSWRPGDKLQAWLLNKSAPRSNDIIQMHMPTEVITQGTPSKSKPAFSTAMSTPPEVRKPESKPLAIPAQPTEEKVAALPDTTKPMPGKSDMWGTGPSTSSAGPGKSLVDGAKKVNPLFAPERITPSANQPQGTTAAAAPPKEGWPLNSQSVLAARSGMVGPVTYIPYPIVTVPQPHQPPMPPDPKLPDAPNLTAYVNAFTPPPAPKGQANPGQPGMMPQGNPMLAQQHMMQQQMMQQQMVHQMMMQQQMLAQQNMMPSGSPSMPQQGMGPMPAQYRQPMISQGPTANGARQYQGPLPPNLTGTNTPMPAYPLAMVPPMAPLQQPGLQAVSYQQPAPAQQPMGMTQIDQLVRVMRESPYPTHREWSAQQLVAFDWRANPQVLHALMQSACHDPAPSVRAGCAYCLGRMQASVEPVLGTLNAMRNDADPRVRQEAEQALVRLGHTPAAAQ